jgi:hypothetical protein
MITMDKQYRYRGGGAAKILSVTASAPYSVVSQDESGDVIRHAATGGYYAESKESGDDLIEVVPLWRGELWVHDYGDVSFTERPSKEGWRKVNVIEVRKDGA